MIAKVARGLRGTLPWLGRRLSRGPTILLYHRVAISAPDPFGLCVPPHQFAEHLDVLAREHAPLGLRELVRRAREGTLPRNAVVVTFDDGYRDNLVDAVPLLAQFDIPATVFITSGHIGQERGFWWDELERIVLRPESLPPSLHIEIGGCIHDWDCRAGRASGPRQRIFRELYDLLIALPEADRLAAQKKLLAWAGIGAETGGQDRALNRDEVGTLARIGLVEIGAHSVSHPLMSRLSHDEQLLEAGESKRALEEIIGSAVTSFAYPYGDFGEATVAAARAAGFEAACTCEPGRVSYRADPLRLPRLEARACDGDRFARSLRWLLD